MGNWFSFSIKAPPDNRGRKRRWEEEDSDNENGIESKKGKKCKHTCIICYGIWQIPTITKCGRVFCKECIEEWFRTNKTCPACNLPSELSEVKPVYED